MFVPAARLAPETATRDDTDRRLPYILSASERLVTARSITDVVDVLRETARAAAGAEGIAVVLKEGSRCAYIAEDAVSPLWQGQSFPSDACVSGWAMRHNETVVISDVLLDDRVPQDAYAPTFVRSLIMVPIGRPEPIAALGAYWSKAVDHDRDTIERLEGLARLATIALENARLAQARDHASALGAAQNRILELAVRDVPLTDALEAIVREVEALSNTGLLGSILLLDRGGERLLHGAAPSLPAAYNKAIHCMAIGPHAGSYGTAAYRNEPVLVADIEADALWVDFKALAREHGLQACWSSPIRSTQGELLGTFAMYHRHTCTPEPVNLELTEFVVRSVALLIERERAAASLHASEARTGFALKAGRLGAWELNVVTGELVTSETCRLNFGRPADQPFTYEELREAVHPDDQARMQAAVQRSLDTGCDYDIEYRVVRPSGEIRCVEIRAKPSFDAAGAPISIAGVSLDVTKRQRTEAALRESEERLRLAVDNAAVGLWDVDMVNDVLIWPARTKAMFGISADVPVTMQDFYDGLHPDDREATSVAYAAACDPERRALYDVDYRTIGKEDGVVRWVAAKGRGVFDAGGRCVRVIGTAVEITARKQAEEALRELNSTLERRVTAAVAEREEAQEALRQSQKMEAMGQLTGGVAHDFNNLLTPIVGALDMLQRKGLGGEREQRLISGAAQSAERARVLVQRLLAFARRQPLQAAPVDVGKLANGMGDLIASTTGPQIRVVVDTPEDLPAAIADPNQLEMALLNLAVNARDAMPDGGTLRISAIAELVPPGHRAGLTPGDYVCLAVADTGAGMNAATLARATEPFFSTKGIGKGTGLGLSMVHGLASQLNGALAIQSRPGVGTNVELWLPRSSCDPLQASEAPEAPGEPVLRGTVLLVDDEELVRASTADMLNDLGYSVVEAASGEEALRLVKSQPGFDLIVTDHLMPGMTGTNLANVIRTANPGISVLLVSGYAESEGVDADLPRLTKPFRKDELATSLAALKFCRVI